MKTQVLYFLVAVAAVAADRRPTYSYGPPQDSFEYSEESAEAKYAFDWAVRHAYSGNDFGHQESRDGDRTQGSYYVQLPDGRLQTVKYFVDGYSGFIPEVEYEGEARYDSAESREYGRPRPVYAAPESEESKESRPVYTPRPLYAAPDSEESLEIPVYIQQQPIYRPVYTTPRPVYTTPRRVYTTPRPVYTTPRRVYTTPRPVYTTPRPVYTTPRPVYSAPESEESYEAPVYAPPQRSYGAPN
ncbi:cuticle protein 21-like [Penaeus chinensis]|uniref:cuticle protein 21-like n=1 Tax=Penaeus chinensis TaxID=139456 RepID=UPI001FB7E224|nr:cuticle protein 21-like [Penaeus chinensis]